MTLDGGTGRFCGVWPHDNAVATAFLKLSHHLTNLKCHCASVLLGSSRTRVNLGPSQRGLECRQGFLLGSLTDAGSRPAARPAGLREAQPRRVCSVRLSAAFSSSATPAHSSTAPCVGPLSTGRSPSKGTKMQKKTPKPHKM